MLKFEHTQFLTFLFAVPALLSLAFLFLKWRKKASEKLGEPAAVERLTTGFSTKNFWVKTVLFVFAIAFLVVALANPQGEGKRQKVKQRSSDIFIALDISQSMLAEDLAPSRLDRAKVFAQNLVKSLPGQRIGLIFFAGNAYLQMPLSTDGAAAISFLKTASPDMVSEQGTEIAAVLKLAEKSFDPKMAAGKAIVLLTDGETHDENALELAEDLREKGISTFAVGVGTAAGAPIPVGISFEGTAYKRGNDGEVVISKLNEKLIRDLAKSGGGSAFFLENENGAVAGLRESLDKLEKREVEARSVTDFETYFQWFLGAAILFLVLEMAWINIQNSFLKNRK